MKIFSSPSLSYACRSSFLPPSLPASPPPLLAVCAAQPRRKRGAVLLLLLLPLTLLRMSVRGSRHAATPLSLSLPLPPCLIHSLSLFLTHTRSPPPPLTHNVLVGFCSAAPACRLLWLSGRCCGRSPPRFPPCVLHPGPVVSIDTQFCFVFSYYTHR